MSKNTKDKSSKSNESILDTVYTTFKQAFYVNNRPLPFIKAFNKALGAALPVLIGLLFGHLDYGLLASLGGFTYLYAFNQPYVQRARRIFFVMLGISFSVMLGTLLAPHPYLSAVVMGLVVAIPIFIFGALRITGPSAIFFILTYAMATAMPIDPSLAPLRGGLVLLGGALSWVMCLLGWFVNPHGPETNALKKVYFSLAELIDSVGTDQFNSERHKTVVVLNETEDILLGAYHSLTKTDKFKRLFLLNRKANAIFLEILELSVHGKDKFHSEFVESVRDIADAIGKEKVAALSIPKSKQDDPDVMLLLQEIAEAITILSESIDHMQQEVVILKPSLKKIFLGSFDKNSIVFLTALRSGIVVLIAALIAVSFDFHRSYWIPLSAASVMAGSTFVGTFHRAVQRSFGTFIGILIAAIVLLTVHNGYIVVLIILVLTFLTETFIVRNYGVAAMFFTPAALVMAEYSSQTFDFQYFASVRIIDVIVGSIIGLAGTILIGNQLASKVLDHFITKTLRSQGQFLIRLFSDENRNISIKENHERSKMQTNLNKLISVFNTALGELRSSKQRLEATWPIIYAVEQIGYYLDASLKHYERPALSEADLSKLLYIFETMAIAVYYNHEFLIKEVPHIEGFPKLRNEIIFLQKVIHLRSDNDLRIEE